MSKIHSTFILLLGIFWGIIVATSSSAQTCSAATDATSMTNGAPGDWNFCDGATPDSLRVSFYKLALCTSKPTYTNDDSCVYILNESTPKTVDIEIGAELNLVDGQISIPENTYRYAFMMIGNKISIKTDIEFSSSQTGGKEGQGLYCWTNGEDITWGYSAKSDMPVSCGTTPEPAFSEENFLAFGDDNGGLAAQVIGQETPTTTFDVYLLHDASTLALVASSGGKPTVSALPANFIWGVQEFKSPPKISPTTTKIELGFKLTEGMQIGFNAQNPGCGGSPCVEGVNLNAFAFSVNAE